MRLGSLLVAIAFGTPVLSGLSGCSFLYELGANQCLVNADCTALGEGFEDRVCMQGVCVINPDPPCSSNAQCLDESFEPSMCIEGDCVTLRTNECPVVLPATDELWEDNLRSTNPLVLGGYANVPETLIGTQIRNYDLALTEFTREAQGIPGPGGQTRPVVMVVCEGVFDDRTSLDNSMTHLTQTLKVPGITSALLADDLRYAFTNFGTPGGANPDGTFMMSPLDGDSLSTLSDQSLVWQVLPGGGSIAEVYRPLLDRTLAYLAVEGPVRVAVITATDIGLLNDALTTLRDPVKGLNFNDRTFDENFAEGTSLLSLGITSIYTDPNVNLSAETSALLAFKPHVVIALAADEFLTAMLPSLEDNWAASADGQAPPFYLLSPIHFSNPGMEGIITGHASALPRMAGVNAASLTAVVDDPSERMRLAKIKADYDFAFTTAYREDTNTNAENFYDAAYYTIFAAAAASNAPRLIGPAMAQAMDRLITGTQVFAVGQANISAALQSLGSTAGAKIRLDGTLGYPSFDVTGARTQLGSVWCIDSGGEFIPDVLTYNAEMGTVDGLFVCNVAFQ